MIYDFIRDIHEMNELKFRNKQTEKYPVQDDVLFNMRKKIQGEMSFCLRVRFKLLQIKYKTQDYILKLIKKF